MIVSLVDLLVAAIFTSPVSGPGTDKQACRRTGPVPTLLEARPLFPRAVPGPLPGVYNLTVLGGATLRADYFAPEVCRFVQSSWSGDYRTCSTAVCLSQCKEAREALLLPPLPFFAAPWQVKSCLGSPTEEILLTHDAYSCWVESLGFAHQVDLAQMKSSEPK